MISYTVVHYRPKQRARKYLRDHTGSTVSSSTRRSLSVNLLMSGPECVVSSTESNVLEQSPPYPLLALFSLFRPQQLGESKRCFTVPAFGAAEHQFRPGLSCAKLCFPSNPKNALGDVEGRPGGYLATGHTPGRMRRVWFLACLSAQLITMPIWDSVLRGSGNDPEEPTPQVLAGTPSSHRQERGQKRRASAGINHLCLRVLGPLVSSCILLLACSNMVFLLPVISCPRASGVPYKLSARGYSPVPSAQTVPCTTCQRP